MTLNVLPIEQVLYKSNVECMNDVNKVTIIANTCSTKTWSRSQSGIKINDLLRQNHISKEI